MHASDTELTQDAPHPGFVRRDEVPALVAATVIELLGLRGMPEDGADLGQVWRLAAAVDSATYAVEHMQGAAQLPTDTAILTDAMDRRTVDGLILEFGVYSGSTINHLATLTPQTVFGFDSFEGLPEDWRPDFRKGAFARRVPPVLPNVELVVGWFNETLPGFLAANPGPISLLHVDCDLYSSTRTILDACRERIVPGTVIVFNEYFNYVGWRHHEHKAFREFIAATGLTYRYVGFVPRHQQVSVVIG